MTNNSAKTTTTPDTRIDIVTWEHKRNRLTAHINVFDYETDEWVGDFFVEYTDGPDLSGEVYSADEWDTVRYGGGIYAEHDTIPSGGLLDHVAEELEKKTGLRVVHCFR